MTENKAHMTLAQTLLHRLSATMEKNLASRSEKAYRSWAQYMAQCRNMRLSQESLEHWISILENLAQVMNEQVLDDTEMEKDILHILKHAKACLPKNEG